jgi:hypothetical protein
MMHEAFTHLVHRRLNGGKGCLDHESATVCQLSSQEKMGKRARKKKEHQFLVYATAVPGCFMPRYVVRFHGIGLIAARRPPPPEDCVAADSSAKLGVWLSLAAAMFGKARKSSFTCGCLCGRYIEAAVVFAH